MPKWTEPQQDAIDARKGTVLVSAAAGSGKTAVLVQRVIERLMDRENPTDADRLLVVTFTKAAAAEMRGRIESALLEEIHRRPGDSRLARQQILLSQANISTVDSFCSKISREFFQLLGISPDFRIVADKQQEDLQNEAITQAIGEIFDGGDTALADVFSSERDDNRLIGAAMTLYKFTRSHLFPDKWLKDKLTLYDSSVPATKNPWGKALVEYGRDTLEYCGNILEDSIKVMVEDDKINAAFAPIFAEDKGQLDILKAQMEQGSWNDISKSVKEVVFSRMPSLRGYSDDPLKIRLQNARGTVKDSIKKLASVFFDSQEQISEDMERIYPVAKALSDLVSRFSEIYDGMKKERNLADYSDIEHYAVQLFLEEKNGAIVKTELAKSVSQRFDEIMIDEYQDTNTVQDCIFRAISKKSNNLFMVGDVKQSIYSFRQAMPEIFIACKDKYHRYKRELDKYPATIVLDKNFRSRPEVIGTVNFVFSMLMSKGAGGVEYVGDEALSQGLECAEKPGCETVVDFIERTDEDSVEISEARHIGDTINKMINSGYTVTDKGVERKATYRDFCVLLRSSNRFAFNYADEMARIGVPTWAAVSGGFFSSPEIQIVTSFLQVIDNPNQDIPLLSLLMSPIYGFTADDIAQVRIKDRANSIYISLLLSEDQRYKNVLEDLEHYRIIAAAMPSDVFINYIYNKTGITDMVLAMKNGESRLANLRRLQQYAGDYEGAGYIGVSGFVRFIDKLKAAKSDMESANLVSENADVVRIMSIHKSKGLEFPVCIIAGCGRKFNSDRNEIALNGDLGLGIKLKDSLGAGYTNIIRDAVMLKNQQNAASEELRIFYVALTRAREKLILVSSVTNLDKTLSSLSAQITAAGKVPEFAVKSVNSISEWLMLCALRHPDGKLLRDRISCDDSIVSRISYTPWDIRAVQPPDFSGIKDTEETIAPASDAVLLKKLKDNCSFVYRDEALHSVPTKVTASAISGEIKDMSLSRPSFLSYKGLTPAERGIALHSYLQFADFSAAATNPKAELERLITGGFITVEQGKSIDLNKVKSFLNSSLGKRISNSPTVKREQRFTVTVNAGILGGEIPAECEDTPVILQGAVDCSFVENGKLYVVDFKTDRVEDSQELIKLYGRQLMLYSNALEQITGLPVDGCYLYSLHLNKEIKVV